MATCIWCGSDLVAITFAQCLTMVCDNWRCPMYRCPQGAEPCDTVQAKPCRKDEPNWPGVLARSRDHYHYARSLGLSSYEARRLKQNSRRMIEQAAQSPSP
jgi:hypothetical protein